MKHLFLSLASLLGLAVSASAQEAPGTASAEQNSFFASAIPKDFPARFLCHQAGAEIVSFDQVRSFAPRQIEGVMTFSLITSNGENHLIYLGTDTTCGLTVTPPPT